MVTLLNSSRSTPSHNKVGGVRSRQRGNQWPSPTSMAYLSQSVGCWGPWPLRSPFAPSEPWGKSWSIWKIPSQNGREKVWCTAFPAMSVREPTLDRLAGCWTITLRNISGLSGIGVWQPQHWQSICLLLGTKWIYPRQQWLMLTLKPRPAAFLRPGTSSMNRPLSTGEGNIARTLCHRAGLPLFCVSIISSVLHSI